MAATEDLTAAGTATVAAYDIARLAGVGRAAVSNWRRRYPDFPQPVGGTAASPLYALSDIESWLVRHRKQFQLLPADRVWHQIRGTVDDLQLGELLAALGGFLVFLRRVGNRWRALSRRDDPALAKTLLPAIHKTVPELPESTTPLAPEWMGILRAAAAATREQDDLEIFEFLHQRYVEIYSRRRPVTPAPVAALMATLVAPSDGIVLDPACGIGTVLLAAQEQGAARLLGQELDPVAGQLAAVRLLLHHADVDIQIGDSLLSDAFDQQTAAAVVCDPPFNDRAWGYDELTSDPRWEYGLPSRSEPELAWAQHCLSHLAPGGHAAVLMPAGSASRRSGRRIRSNLLRTGVLRAVITLPPAGPGNAVSPDLWLLTQPVSDQPSSAEVLMVDASRDLEVAREAWQVFTTRPKTTLPDQARVVPVIDLLDDEVDISPLRHVPRAVHGDGSEFQQVRKALTGRIDSLLATLPDFAPPGPEARRRSANSRTGQRPEMTVGELLRAGLLTIHQAPLRMVIDSGTTPVLTASDVRQHRAPSGRTTAEPGMIQLAVGDVVVPTATRDPLPLVITEPDQAVLGPQLYLLRTDPERLDPYFLAGFLRIRHTHPSHRMGATSSRSDLSRVTLPRLPLEEQRQYGDAFRKLVTFEAETRQVAALTESLIQQALAGLATGQLHPGS
jgi:SAM-dependent methyltransferase